jgi:hypothetical protein
MGVEVVVAALSFDSDAPACACADFNIFIQFLVVSLLEMGGETRKRPPKFLLYSDENW